MADSFAYPDKMSFRETIMFHIRCMSSELASDGLKNEYEDMVDMLGWLLWTLMDEETRTKWGEAESHEEDLIRTDDVIAWGKAKRHRCQEKMRLAMGSLDKAGLLHKKVREHDPDMEMFNDLPTEGA